MKAHRTDGVSLVFGLIFAGIAVWWLLARLLDIPLPAVGWLLVLALILIGLFGLIGALRAGRSTGGSGGDGRAAGPAGDGIEPPVPGTADEPVTVPLPPDRPGRA